MQNTNPPLAEEAATFLGQSVPAAFSYAKALQETLLMQQLPIFQREHHCWGALVLAMLLVVRTGLFLAVGAYCQFPGPIPWVRMGLFTFVSWAVSMMVYALQQGLSLRFANQAAALVSGIAGSFLGVLSMLFPAWLTRCVPWGYYGLLALVGMDWDSATRVTRFFWQWPRTADVLLLMTWTVAFLAVGRTMFVTKEV